MPQTSSNVVHVVIGSRSRALCGAVPSNWRRVDENGNLRTTEGTELCEDCLVVYHKQQKTRETAKQEEARKAQERDAQLRAIAAEREEEAKTKAARRAQYAQQTPSTQVAGSGAQASGSGSQTPQTDPQTPDAKSAPKK